MPVAERLLLNTAMRCMRASSLAMLAVAGVYALPVRVQTSPAESCVMIQELNANRALTTQGKRLFDAGFRRPRDFQDSSCPRRARDRSGDRSIDRKAGRHEIRSAAEMEPRAYGYLGAAAVGALGLSAHRSPHRCGADARMADEVRLRQCSVSDPITEYWTNGSLEISVPEQVRFLVRLYREELPVRPEHMRAVPAASSRIRGWSRIPGASTR